MDPGTLLDYGNRIENELKQNILPFWLQHAVDPCTGRFHGEISNDLRVNPHADRGALLTCRILWTFSAAYRTHGDRAYLQMADRAYNDLVATFRDDQHGGLFWSTAADGEPRLTRKQTYGQAFGIYALAEYTRATRRSAPLEFAIALFHLIEANARDTEHGGYFEAFARDWSPVEDQRLSEVDLNEPKSQNTLLHVMEAYTNLLRVWPEEALRRAQTALIDLMLTRVINPTTHHLGLFFSSDWKPRSDRISYGHDIEASWLLTEAAEVLGDTALLARVRPAALKIAETTLSDGVDHDGAIFNEGGPDGVTDTKREWWPQAEAVVGFLNAAQLSGGDDRFVEAALRTWDVIDRVLIDRKHGEWFRFATRDGLVSRDEPKISFWKCPYHNGRTCLEGSLRLRALAASSCAPNVSPV